MDESKFKVFDAAEFLDNEEIIAEYLSDAIEEGDSDALLTAIATVARARGMSKLAEDSGLGRESLYKTLRPGSKPCYETIVKILTALNVKLHILPKQNVQLAAG